MQLQEWNGAKMSPEDRNDMVARLNRGKLISVGTYIFSGDTIVIMTSIGILECKVMYRHFDNGPRIEP